MTAVTAVALVMLLVGLGITLVAVMVLQEARTRRRPAERAYVIDDAIDHALESVDPDVRDRVGKVGVRRIIEWSVHYLQGLAEPGARRRGVTVVAGGEGGAIDYIVGELAKRGHAYAHEDVAAVLATEADYLHSIGALGAVVDEAELA